MRLDEQVQAWLTRTPGLIETLFDRLPDVLFYVRTSRAATSGPTRR